MSANEIAQGLGFRKKRGRITPEGAVLSACFDWLNTIPGCVFFRRNTGAMTSEYKGRRRFIRFNRRGMVDLWGIIPGGIHCEIECKAPGEKLTDHQSAWLESMIAKGSVAFYVDSIETCVDQLKAAFESRGIPWRKEWEV